MCREVASNVTVPLMYLHHHLTKYLNIVAKYVKSCNSYGLFNNRPVNPVNLFHSDYHYSHKLISCFKKRNLVDWFEACLPVCEEFKMGEYNTKFFTPRLKKVFKYTKFLQKELVRWDKQDEEHRKKNGERLLAEVAPVAYYTKAEKRKLKVFVFDPASIIKDN